MKSKVSTLALAGLLAAAAFVLPAKPAAAHNYDQYSTWFCAGHRPNGTVLVHSWPDVLQPGLLRLWCQAGIYGYDFQYWVWVDVATGGSWMGSGYQPCKPQGIVWCGWPPAH